MNFNLENKKVLITGSSGGIGTALVNKFIDYKAKIICTSSNQTNLDKLKSDYGNDNYYYLLDFSNINSLSKNIKIISNEHPDIDILINNAGITNDNLFLRMKESQWEEVIKINLNSNFYILKEILPNMLKRKSGNIIGITSVIAFTGNQGQANYAASKSALISMYKSISLEVSSRNIRVNSIAPGFIKTNMTDKLSDLQTEEIMKKIPLKKLGEAEDVANMALFLSSDMSSYITGQTFHVNGGMLMF